MRLIDLDAFRADYELREHCEECGRYGKKDCDYPSYSARDFCGWLDDAPTVDAIPIEPLDKLCEFLADTLHTPAPCFNNEEICPHMDFGYCRLPDAPDVKECWKKILTKWMEGLDAAD